MKDRNLNGGYIGIAALLLSLAFIIFFIVKTDLFSGRGDGKSMIEQDKEPVDSAEAVRAKIEMNSRNAAEE